MRYEWTVLANRIRGLMQAAELHARYLTVRATDGYGRTKRLREQCERVVTALKTYQHDFGPLVPEHARAALSQTITTCESLVIDTDGTSEAREERVWATLVQIASFEAEMTFLLSDTQFEICALTELAFEHLQRSIVVDNQVRQNWVDAFTQGEVACEKLGAVHLLLHGIWAFKIDAKGERTDLAYQEPLNERSRLGDVARGLVLTEWKLATSGEQIEASFAAARAQAQIYSVSALGGLELSQYRYAIVVSQKRHLDISDTVQIGSTIYRHINIAVDPDVPSRTALLASRK
jgi:hypothetical protein